MSTWSPLTRSVKTETDREVGDGLLRQMVDRSQTKQIAFLPHANTAPVTTAVENGPLKPNGPPPGRVWTWPNRPGAWPRLGLFLLVASAYALGSQLALWLIEASELQGVLFIPSGITVAFLLRLSRRHWPVVLLAAGLTEFVMDVTSGLTIAEALGFALANAAEPLAGALIVTSVVGAVDLGRRRDVLWFIVGAVFAGPALGAAIGAGSDRLFGADDFLVTFIQWWLGDALGVILVGSAILVWGSSPDRRSIISAWGLLLVAGSSALTVIVMITSDLPLVFSVLIGVVVAGVLFGVRAVAMTALAIAMTVAVTLVLESGDLIVGLTPAAALVVVKLQMATFTLAGLLIAAESHEREFATQRVFEAAVEAEAVERERRLEQDLAIQIQRGLLPDRLLQLPGVSIAARYEAASDALKVGGDWYDTFDLGNGRVGLVVGDVVGHGIESMTSMGRLRTAVAALAPHYEDPAQLMSAIDVFAAGPDGTAYATVFYAIFDTNSYSVRYSAAGHPPGLVLTAEGKSIWLDQGQSEPLSGRPSGPRKSAEIRLERGALLLLYSDGLIERRTESLSTGLSRLENMASRHAAESPDQLCESLFANLAGPRREDDVVLLAVKTHDTEFRDFHESFPARPEELHRIRASLRSWMDEGGLPAVVRDDLLIAVGEVTANAVVHAYANEGIGEVDLRVSRNDDVVHVRVTDRGTWKLRKEESDSPGLGTDIIRSITEDLQIDATEDGTAVSFRLSAIQEPT